MTRQKITFLSLLLYGIGMFSSHIHHVFTNSNSHVHNEAHDCSEDKKLNLCHISAYHFDFVNGCKHNTHYKTKTIGCDICDLMAQQPEKYFSRVITSFKPFAKHSITKRFNSKGLILAFHQRISNKGPPASSIA